MKCNISQNAKHTKQLSREEKAKLNKVVKAALVKYSFKPPKNENKEREQND